MSQYIPVLTKLPRSIILYQEYIGPYWDFEHKDDRVRLEKAFDFVKYNPDLIRNSVMGIFYDNPKDVPPDKCRIDICIPIKSDIYPPDDFKKKIFQARQVIMVRYKGAYYSLEKNNIYRAIHDWLIEHPDYEFHRPAIELYVNSPFENDENDLITEIYYPIKKI